MNPIPGLMDQASALIGLQGQQGYFLVVGVALLIAVGAFLLAFWKQIMMGLLTAIVLYFFYTHPEIRNGTPQVPQSTSAVSPMDDALGQCVASGQYTLAGCRAMQLDTLNTQKAEASEADAAAKYWQANDAASLADGKLSDTQVKTVNVGSGGETEPPINTGNGEQGEADAQMNPQAVWVKHCIDSGTDADQCTRNWYTQH